MRLKTKLVSGAGSLVLATSLMAVAAPAAHAVITSGGSCQNTVLFAKLTTPVKGVGLGDQTINGVKVAGNLAKDQTSKLAVNGGGTCTGTFTRPGDAHVPNGANPTLTPKSQATSLFGNASCANGTNDKANDATAANAWPLAGKITWTFNQTYNDLVTAAPKPYKMQADIAILGFNPGFLDVVDIGGVVLSGADSGFNVTGNIWEDPVFKDNGSAGYNTGYDLDLIDAAGCADDDGSPPSNPAMINNANILQVLSGGGPTTPSLLGSTATGIVFQAGE